MAPSLRLSLPPWPLATVFRLIRRGAWLRRVARWYSNAFCPAYARMSGFLSSLFTAVVLRPSLASRVQEIAAAVSRPLPGGPCVSLGGTPAPALRFSAASHRSPVCGMLAFHAHANTIA